MRKIDPSQSVKRAGSPIAGGSGCEAKKRSQEKVEVLEDVWLEAIKHISCPKWSKMRLISHQLDGLIERNVSRLPLAILDNVEMRLEQREKAESEIIAKDSMISSDQKIQWFKDRAITFYLPADIELNNAIIGVDFKEKRSFDLRILGDTEKFDSRVLFYAEFSPHRNPYSWPSMAYLLKLIYDQSTFVKILFSGKKERYIRCGSFKLQMPDGEKLYESLLWLEQNVHADKIKIPTRRYSYTFLDYEDEEICDAMSSFLFCASWISASQEVNVGHVNELEDFFRSLVKKFQTVSAVQSTFPIITFSGYRILGSIGDERIKRLLSGKEETSELEDLEDDDDYEDDDDDESDDSGDERDSEMYTVSNGANQMRVEFMETPPGSGPPRACKRARNMPKLSEFDIRVTVETSF